jgi:nucleoside-diphosphate-sugar epimerase
VVFTSSIAVFGAPMPDVIPDDFNLTPLTSYGTQKAMSELLLADYTRRGFIDGIGIRLPTICVRPGKPNKAASGFFSGIIREPLSGQPAILPVPDTVRHWHASPRSAVGFLIHAASIDLEPLALRAIAGDKAVALIRREPDELVMRIVGGWARAFAPERATRLGFVAETSFEEIIRVHIEDEMEGSIR